MEIDVIVENIRFPQPPSSVCIDGKSYFYVIQNIENGMLYAGSKYGKDADVTNLLTIGGYITSSKTIKKIIDHDGLDKFRIVLTILFSDKNQAIQYETEFLILNDVRNNVMFYNLHDNTSFFDLETRTQKIVKKYGVQNIHQNSKIRQKIRETNIKKYGYAYPTQNSSVKEKTKNTIRVRYGVNSQNLHPTIKKKIETSNIKRYGFAHRLKNPIEYEKYKKQLLKKYGVTNLQKSPVIQNIKKQNYITKYGVSHHMHLSDIKNKIVETCLKKYGTNNPVQNPEILKKIQDTVYQRYGVTNVMHIDEIKEKMKKTNIQKYGVPCVLMSDEIQNKIVETCLKKYGVEQYSKTEESRKKKSEFLQYMLNRQVVTDIKKYTASFGIKLGQNWTRRKTETLEKILNDLIDKYGKI